MDELIKVGVAGFGYWGPNLVRNFNAHSGARVVGVCDAIAERADRAARLYPGVRTTTEFDDLLRDPSIDLIACATPVSSHHRLGMAALQAGKHILLEKPMASSARECEELLALAAERGLRIFVDHTYIFTPAVQKMKAMIDAGDLGRVFYYDSTRINLGLYQRDVDVLWDLAPHDLSIVDYLLDGTPPEAVSCTGVRHFGEHADQAYLTLAFPGAFYAHVHVNWLAPVKVRQVLICADKRMVVYDELAHGEQLRVYDRGVRLNGSDDPYQHLVQYRDGDMWAPRLENREALATEVANIVAVLRGEAEPIVDGQRGYRVVSLLERLSASLADGGVQHGRSADEPLERLLVR